MTGASQLPAACSVFSVRCCATTCNMTGAAQLPAALSNRKPGPAHRAGCCAAPLANRPSAVPLKQLNRAPKEVEHVRGEHRPPLVRVCTCARQPARTPCSRSKWRVLLACDAPRTGCVGCWAAVWGVLVSPAHMDPCQTHRKTCSHGLVSFRHLLFGRREKCCHSALTMFSQRYIRSVRNALTESPQCPQSKEAHPNV
eukprot:365061-Chlamydomonas_euryale.AAC.2